MIITREHKSLVVSMWHMFRNTYKCGAPETISPLHENCHCTTTAISTARVKKKAHATSAFSKFDPYLFNTFGLYSHGKEKLFVSWGSTVADARWLQNEIEQQGRTKYIAGNYTLGKRNVYGQRITQERQ